MNENLQYYSRELFSSRMDFITILLYLLLLCVLSGHFSCENIRKPTKLITYKTINNQSLQLHIFEPINSHKQYNRSCFISIHGGGWMKFTPENDYVYLDYITSLDYDIVGIGIEYHTISKNNPNNNIII